MSLQESGEMYLETIHVLSKKSANVRAVDIAEELGYSRPSVSRAMHILKADGKWHDRKEPDENSIKLR